jgi:hypothetical protein
MPTWAATAEFWRGWKRLTPRQRTAFLAARDDFIADLAAGRFRPGLGVKRFRASEELYELRWSDAGRALWRFGPQQVQGEQHIEWIAIGGHEIYDRHR